MVLTEEELDLIDEHAGQAGHNPKADGMLLINRFNRTEQAVWWREVFGAHAHVDETAPVAKAGQAAPKDRYLVVLGSRLRDEEHAMPLYVIQRLENLGG